VNVLATQKTIDNLAERIERAYRLRRPDWRGVCSTSRIWSVAAMNLLQVHESDPSLPPDPELFVAAQPGDARFADPWLELTRPEAARFYRRGVRSIVRRLKRELSAEVEHAESRIGSGEGISRVLRSKSPRLSPLGRYIVALRAGRKVLAKRFVADLVEQHRACPLYRDASLAFIPPEVYPVTVSSKLPIAPARRRSRAQVSLN
jgi:hypothetical protein